MKNRVFTLAAAVWLALCLTLGANAASVVAHGYCGADDGTNLSWTLYSDGRLTITGSGMMAEAPDWIDYADEIQTVSLGSGVTSIGDYAFYECAALASLSLPTSMTEIGDCAFYGCAALKSVALGSGVARIGVAVFDGCASLTAITVNPANRSFRDADGVLFNAVGDVLYAYPAGRTQTAYTIPASVTAVEDYAFAGCRSLTRVVIPDSVASIGNGMFMNCSALISADIPDSVTSIGNDAFSGCASLTSVVIPRGVTNIGDGAFSGCASLTAISVREGNSSFQAVEGVLFNDDGTELYAYPAGREAAFYNIPYGVRMIGSGAFKGCEALTEAAIPNSVSIIGDYAFAECRALTEIMIPKSVFGVGNYAFEDCEALETVYYGGEAEDLEFCVNEMGNDCLLDALIHGMASEPLSVVKLGLDGGQARATVYAPTSTAAYLALYGDDGRFLGVAARMLRDGELGTLTLASPEAVRAKLMLLDASGAPLCAAEEM